MNTQRMIRVSGPLKAINQITSYLDIRIEDGLQIHVEEVLPEEIERNARALVHEWLEERTGTGEALAALLTALNTPHGEEKLLATIRRHRARTQIT